MRNSELYALLAKLTIKLGETVHKNVGTEYDFERDPDFTDDERGFIRQGINDLKFYQPGFAEKAASCSQGEPLMATGAKRVSGGQAKRV